MSHSKDTTPEKDYEALETVARVAIEIIRDLRNELGLERGQSLLTAVKQLHEKYLVAQGMHVVRDVLEEQRQKAQNGS
jgi:flagellin-specific chaperone FliS